VQVCDWGEEPRKCLFAYCCGTIAHRLGERRGDYKTTLPSVADRVEADFETRHLAAWQRICSPEQTFYDKQVSIVCVVLCGWACARACWEVAGSVVLL
jgi:hypothetical protein